MMAIRVDINGVLAVVEDGVWSSENKNFEVLLNSYVEEFVDESVVGFGPGNPYPDLLFAQFVVKRVGGRIFEEDVKTPAVVKGRMY